MSLHGSSFIGGDKNMIAGFYDDVIDGSFFIEYKDNCDDIVIELSRKSYADGQRYGYAKNNKKGKKYQKQMKLWIKRMYVHYYG